FASKRRVAGTGCVQESRPLLRGVLLDRRQKDRFGLVGRIAHDDGSREARTPLCKPMRIRPADFLTTDGKRKRIVPGSGFRASPKLTVKPGTGVIPVSVRGSRREAKRLAGLFDRQAREVTQLDEPGRRGICTG